MTSCSGLGLNCYWLKTSVFLMYSYLIGKTMSTRAIANGDESITTVILYWTIAMDYIVYFIVMVIMQVKTTQLLDNIPLIILWLESTSSQFHWSLQHCLKLTLDQFHHQFENLPCYLVNNISTLQAIFQLQTYH